MFWSSYVSIYMYMYYHTFFYESIQNCTQSIQPDAFENLKNQNNNALQMVLHCWRSWWCSLFHFVIKTNLTCLYNLWFLYICIVFIFCLLEQFAICWIFSHVCGGLPKQNYTIRYIQGDLDILTLLLFGKGKVMIRCEHCVFFVLLPKFLYTCI